ncbi:hypothetical protein PPTG_07957 [Phytophthora nicotianae INRA-310]|uniref:Uncharacterized protein n=1 Tax=Phytophthora nicotianae (strain INRA-310) TaxID=761204 RepID=W2QN19_PHYN3|nr:hypothetical protein PPTG_07957 [Phytophthora nicotianae INRA-310]ETN14336.1 hypothetical protein PPTG_07957 [Phytophthora nicotianae INRA-310]
MSPSSSSEMPKIPSIKWFTNSPSDRSLASYSSSRGKDAKDTSGEPAISTGERQTAEGSGGSGSGSGADTGREAADVARAMWYLATRSPAVSWTPVNRSEDARGAVF